MSTKSDVKITQECAKYYLACEAALFDLTFNRDRDLTYDHPHHDQMVSMLDEARKR